MQDSHNAHSLNLLSGQGHESRIRTFFSWIRICLVSHPDPQQYDTYFFIRKRDYDCELFKIAKALQLLESVSTMSVSTMSVSTMSVSTMSVSTMSVSTMSDPNLQQYFKVFGTIACVKAKQFQNVT